MALRLVLVDDDRRFRAPARRVLVADGVEVVAGVERGDEVREAVAEWRPEVVLLDIGLPGMDGREVARQLRADSGSLVVILMSSRDASYGRRRRRGTGGWLSLQGRALADGDPRARPPVRMTPGCGSPTGPRDRPRASPPGLVP